MLIIISIDASTIEELKCWNHVTLTRHGSSSIDPSQRNGDICLETTVDGDTHSKKSDMTNCIKVPVHLLKIGVVEQHGIVIIGCGVHGKFIHGYHHKVFQWKKTRRKGNHPNDWTSPFHVSAIPVGAYEPLLFIRDSHCDPDEAIQIHQDIMSRKSLAITFPLVNEPYGDPPIRLHIK
jgi:hypothetical protein